MYKIRRRIKNTKKSINFVFIIGIKNRKKNKNNKKFSMKKKLNNCNTSLITQQKKVKNKSIID